MPFARPEDPYRDVDYVPIEVCAQLMDTSVDAVRRLIRLRVLRTRWDRGTTLVQPAVTV
jgi:hypothetical protein